GDDALCGGAYDLPARLAGPEPWPGRRRPREARVRVHEAEDLRVRADRRPRHPLREPLALLALVVLQHRLDDTLVRRRPLPDEVGRAPRVRLVLRLLGG